MTSIGNDAFTIGTAAVAAGTANLGYQNREALRKNIINPVLSKDTYVGLKNKAKSKIINAKRTCSEKIRNRKAPKIAKEFETIGSKDLSFAKKLKNTFKNIGEKSSAFVKNVNWKTVGKYAGVAAAVATTAVVVKNLLFKSED